MCIWPRISFYLASIFFLLSPVNVSWALNQPFTPQWMYDHTPAYQPSFQAAAATASHASPVRSLPAHATAQAQYIAQAVEQFWVRNRQSLDINRQQINAASPHELVVFAATVQAHIKSQNGYLAQLQSISQPNALEKVTIAYTQHMLQYLGCVNTYIGQKIATDTVRTTYTTTFGAKTIAEQEIELALLKKKSEIATAKIEEVRSQVERTVSCNNAPSLVEQSLQELLYEHERTTIQLDIVHACKTKCAAYKKEFACYPLPVLQEKNQTLAATINAYESHRSFNGAPVAESVYQDCLLQRMAIWDLIAQKKYTSAYEQSITTIRTCDMHCATEQVYRTHVAAIDRTIQNHGAVYQASYCLEPAVKALLDTFKLPYRSWEKVLANNFEHALIKENLDTLSQVAILNDSWKKYEGSHEHIRATTCLSAAAVELTQAGAIKEATWATNIAHALFCINDFEIRFANAFAQGIGQSGLRTIDMVQHPIQTVQELAGGVKVLGSLAWQAKVHLTHMHRHPIETYERLSHGIKCLASCIDQIAQEGIDVQWARARGACAGLSVEKIGIFAGNIAGDIFIPGAIFKGAKQVSRFVALEEGLLALKNIAQSEVGILKALAAQKWTATTETLKVVAPICSATAAAIGDVARPVGQFIGQELLKIYPVATRFVAKGQTVAREAASLVKVERYVAMPAAVDLERLQAKCRVLINKLAETAQLPVKIVECDLKHILGFDCSITCKASGAVKFDWKGFHHDPFNILRDSKVIELANVVECSNGVTKADVIYQGAMHNKTIFPALWESEKVLEKVFEACKNLVAQPFLDRGDWILQGLTQEGIKVQIVLTVEGILKAAYPVVI